VFLSKPAKKLSVSSKVSVIDGSSLSQNPCHLHRLRIHLTRPNPLPSINRNAQANSTGFSQGPLTEIHPVVGRGGEPCVAHKRHTEMIAKISQFCGGGTFLVHPVITDIT